MKALKITGWGLLGLTVFTGAMALLALILSSLWNWLMPGIFNLPEITYWQAIGLFILSKLLFTPGFGKGNHSHKHHPHKEWKHKFARKCNEKWAEKELGAEGV